MLTTGLLLVEEEFPSRISRTRSRILGFLIDGCDVPIASSAARFAGELSLSSRLDLLVLAASFLFFSYSLSLSFSSSILGSGGISTPLGRIKSTAGRLWTAFNI